MKELIKKPVFWIIVIVLGVLAWMAYRYYNCLNSLGSKCTKSSDGTIKPLPGNIVPGNRKVIPTPIAFNPSIGKIKCNFFTGKKCI